MPDQPTTTTITLVVSQHDIDDARPSSPCFCPVARALRKVIIYNCGLQAYPGEVWFYPYDDRMDRKITVLLPADLTKFMEAFDGLQFVRPQEFEVPNFPMDLIRVGAIV